MEEKGLGVVGNAIAGIDRSGLGVQLLRAITLGLFDAPLLDEATELASGRMLLHCR